MAPEGLHGPSGPGGHGPSGPDGELLDVGFVVGPHGIRGAVRIGLHDERSEAIAVARTLVLDPEGTNAARTCTVQAVSAVPGHPGHFRVTLSGVSTREAAEALKGARVLARRSDLPPLGDDEFYLADAIGLQVRRTHAGGVQTLGTVIGVTTNGAQDLFEVEWTGSDGRVQTWLLPVLPGFVLDVGEDAIAVDVPLGMLPEELEIP